MRLPYVTFSTDTLLITYFRKNDMKRWVSALALTSICLSMGAAAVDDAQGLPKMAMSQAQQDKLVSEAKDLLDNWDGNGNYLDKAFEKITLVLNANYAAFLLYKRGDPDASIKEANAALKLTKYGMAEQVLASALYGKGVETFKANPQKGQEYIDEARKIGLDWDTLMINAAASSGESPVMQDIVLDLMKSASKSIDVQDEEGLTGLMKASASGNVKSIEWLIRNGADPEIKDHLGHTAMYLASASNYPDEVRVLGKLKAKPDVVDKQGLTPLIIAVVYNFNAVVDALLSVGANPDFKGTSNDPNAVTPLMLAAEIGNMSSVKSLLAAGANARIQMPANSPQAGKTAASIADFNGHKDVAQLLHQAMQSHPKLVEKPNSN